MPMTLTSFLNSFLLTSTGVYQISSRISLRMLHQIQPCLMTQYYTLCSSLCSIPLNEYSPSPIYKTRNWRVILNIFLSVIIQIISKCSVNMLQITPFHDYQHWHTQVHLLFAWIASVVSCLAFAHVFS